MIGLTFDGNLLTAATLTDGGEIFEQAEKPAPGNAYREWLLSVSALIESLRNSLSNTDRLGVALPAIIHDGTVCFSPYSVLGTVNIHRDLQSVLGMPVSIFGIGGCLVADACRMGAAKDANLAVGMWIGNSCHGGLALAGSLITGAHGAAANWPHLQLPAPLPQELDGRKCWCGRSGCLETFLSVSGLEGDYERVTGEWRDAGEIAAAASKGDIVADSILQAFEDRLGRATATLISLIDPDVIVLGGAGLQLDRLQERIPRKWPGYVQIDRSATRLATAKGGVTPVIRGAAFLAAEDAA